MEKYRKRSKGRTVKIRKSYIVSTILLLLIGMQFIRPARNYSEAISESSLIRIYEVPETVSRVLQKACFDCHSNTTRYPWYSNVQPLGWILANHIRKGKADLNFDEFGKYSGRKQKNKLKAVVNQIRDDKMPLRSYTWMHKDARLSEDEKQLLINWFTK